MKTTSQRLNGILKTGFSIWKKSFKAVIPFSILFAVITISYEIILKKLGFEYDFQYNVFFYYSGNNGKYLLATVSFLVLVFILNSALIHQMHQAHNKSKSCFHEGLLVGFEKSFHFFAVCFLALFMILLGTLLFVVPGVVFSICVIFAPYLIIIGKNSIIGSIRESFRLISGHWWFVATVFFVITLGFLALSVLIGVFAISGEALKGAMMGKSMSFYNNGYIALLTDFLVIALLYPLFNACNLALLYDLQKHQK